MKKEIANSAGRFTDAEIEQRIKESRKFWDSPQGKIRERQLKLDDLVRGASQTSSTSKHHTVEHKKRLLDLTTKNTKL